jgi:hypothetical protein
MEWQKKTLGTGHLALGERNALRRGGGFWNAEEEGGVGRKTDVFGRINSNAEVQRGAEFAEKRGEERFGLRRRHRGRRHRGIELRRGRL